jgi:two-component system sensor histidine kinase UhpB
LASALVMGIAALLLAVTPVTISAPISLGQLLIVVAGLSALLLVNLAILRRVLDPLERLTALMSRIDPAEPDERIELGSRGTEVEALSRAFNQMLDRLERERRESARVALAAQERERQRIAGELHDEIGQSLTAAAIQIERVADGGQDAAADLHDVAEAVRRSLDDVRRIARELRPEALDDLGLINALIALCSRVSAQRTVRVERRLATVPRLSPDIELVIYRVAQESLTNVVRHAHASAVVVALAPANGSVVLSITDDGRGLPSPLPGGTAGISGMRERARLANGTLTIESAPGRGTAVRIEIPLEDSDDADSA